MTNNNVLPETYGVVVAMPIGWPIGNFGPVSRKPAESITYFDTWEDTTPGASLT